MSRTICIAEVGSTKGNWHWVREGAVVHQTETAGFNPVYHPLEQLHGLLTKLPKDPVTEEVYYYGSGCLNSALAKNVETVLQTHFAKKAKVHSDLLAVARACCTHIGCWVVILGTGSSLSLYDGENIHPVPSLGYIFGEEASGNEFGKQLLKDYFRERMPTSLLIDFKTRYRPVLEMILKKVYDAGHASESIASYAYFLSHHPDHPYVQSLVDDQLAALFDRVLLPKYREHQIPVSFSGSIAQLLSGRITDYCKKYGMALGQIVKEPSQGLINYHVNSIENE